MELLDYMKYEQLNAILTSLEERYSMIAKDGSNSLLLNNLNPIKTACHLLILLKRIEGRYSLTRLRTDELSDIIKKRARAVLNHLFFPLQMKYQIRQVDLMNKTSLYYLEHLDAFSIMQSHIMDRVM